MVIALLIKNSLLKSLYENLDFNGEFEVKIKIKKRKYKTKWYYRKNLNKVYHLSFPLFFILNF